MQYCRTSDSLEVAQAAGADKHMLITSLPSVALCRCYLAIACIINWTMFYRYILLSSGDTPHFSLSELVSRAGITCLPVYCCTVPSTLDAFTRAVHYR